MATIAGGSFGVPSSRISITTPTLSSSSLLPPLTLQSGTRKDNLLRCALQESSTSAVATEKKNKEEGEESTVAVPAKKPKPAAKAAAVAKPLRQMMEEDVIPPLQAILESQDDISDIDLSFQDDKLEGFFLKKSIPYSFWAFFPTGNLTGAKGFSISSHGSGPSTVEPFLVDERKPTANHVVFWVEKRLAAQGIIPVWNQ
ncbi:DUF2996 family protein [Arabidopsis thaliana]|uniref:At2g04039/At2g04039 n=2 Tax=Arabidopsis thaliana TaxID=3702 RepID=Q93Z84_ARATH|nr:DUF2996 family protein [Arabidopsis thaliana]AAL24157.1 unknown protein [Arabidopsis thaliana]AAL90955.1 At2g04039/At2g04039 [Arabidopsis thaliana]AAM15442.1 predicted protein [Arabidopsis thaliana]AAM63915.1 unknown [Arabidopsis thaliana]AEC05788.1 DUF2996 family protein [Arabidopsis thaliana]|eukprot:NP_565308.1 DUF2996 family protein [Arabidopsis thaliana]